MINLSGVSTSIGFAVTVSLTLTRASQPVKMVVHTVTTNSYRSLAWIVVPVILIPLGLYIRSRLAARKLAKTGIGKGAPGFQTGVKRIAVTPEIAARLRAGEQVSPEEIEAAVAAAKAQKEAAEKRDVPKKQEEDENEWLPDELKRSNKNGTKSKRTKRRR